MIAILFAIVLISSPSQVNVNETFNVLITAMNVNDLAAFQIDLNYENLELIKVEKGNAIQNWSIFDYNIISSNKIRIIAAKFREKSIDGGDILNLSFKARGEGYASIDLEGVLSDSDGNEISAEFRNMTINVIYQTEQTVVLTPTLITTKRVEQAKSLDIVQIFINYWYIVILIILLLTVGIWRWRY